MSKHSQFAWQQYLQDNRPDMNIKSFKTWCSKNRPKKSVFDTEQELLKAISLYNNRQTYSEFNWRYYLKDDRPDINIKNFELWCILNRPKKSIFNTEQELIKALQIYDNRIKRSQFNWKQYLQDNRQDISIGRFKSWCINNRPKKSVFDTKQELLQTILLYDNRQTLSKFNWRQYLQDNRPDVTIISFKNWCNKNRPKKCIFNTEQELIQELSLYDNRQTYSEFEWQQYIKENRPDINIVNFRTWCSKNIPKKSIFDTEQELLEAISLYNLHNKYIVRKTKYQGIYNLIEKETGLKFNFYRLEDMIGLL